MPFPCVMVRCNVNGLAADTYIPVFSFPNDDDRRQKWIQFVHRKNWVPSKSSRICIQHFDDKFIRIKGVRLRLTEDAIPTKQSSGLPEYLNIKLVNDERMNRLKKREAELKKREAELKEREDERLKELKQQECQRLEELKEQERQRLEEFRKDIIFDFDIFKKGFRSRMKSSSWLIFEGKSIVLYILDISNIPRIIKAIRIRPDLTCEVFVNHIQIPTADLLWALSSTNKISQWSAFENLLNRYENEILSENALGLSTIEHTKKAVRNSFEQLIEAYKLNDYDNDTEVKRMKFIFEQFTLTTGMSTCRTYSPQMLVWSFMILLQSSSTYACIRETEFLVLPHSKYLKQLSSSYLCSPDSEKENKHFLKSRCLSLSEDARFVSLQMDEIHVKEHYEYKGGKIIGVAENFVKEQPGTKKMGNEKTTVGSLTQSTTCVMEGSKSENIKTQSAKTVQAFLIESTYRHFKEVVALHPVKNLDGSELHKILDKVIRLILNCGFYIVAIISDNNKINGTAFNLLNPTRLTPHVMNLNNSSIRTFLTFDSVHDFKNFRNNWVNQKDVNKTFVFPDFDDFNIKREARFLDLRRLYRKNRFMLLKNASKLSHRSLFPSNLDRQKVSLACHVFHESTLAAVKTEFESNSGVITSEGTFKFIDIILKWWTIMNIKSPFQGIRKRNPWAEPFRSVDDDRLKFLERFLLWLEKWESNGGAGLTRETHAAVYRTTLVTIEFIRYSLNELQAHVTYVCPGKALQTDPLEKRFSCYRQYSGGNYNISVSQVLESEKKIRMKSLLGLKSSKYGIIKFATDDNCAATAHNEDDNDELLDINTNANNNDFCALWQIIDNIDYLQMESELEEGSLLVVSGYAAFKLEQKLTCSLCVGKIVSHEISNDYFSELNRGGLTVPTNEVVIIGLHIMCISSVLISEKYEALFLNYGHHKKLIQTLSNEAILKHDPELRRTFLENCPCSADGDKIFRKLVTTFTNIALNNYSKLKNDDLIASKAASGKKRKHTTYEKVIIHQLT